MPIAIHYFKPLSSYLRNAIVIPVTRPFPSEGGNIQFFYRKCLRFSCSGDVCGNTQTRVPPVAAEGGTSKEEHGRQGRRQRGRIR